MCTQLLKNHGDCYWEVLWTRYLIIRNIPIADVIEELIQQLALYGTIEEYNLVYDSPSAPFTQTVWVKYEKTSAARYAIILSLISRQAKSKMNKTSFFGQDLWIQYAPEYESIEDTRLKLDGRRLAVRQRLEELVVERPDETVHEYKRKLRIPVALMSTGGLMDMEEAKPADDFVELQKGSTEVELEEDQKRKKDTENRSRGIVGKVVDGMSTQ